MIIRSAVVLAVALSLAGPAAAAEWQTYVNERFGTTAEVPSGWRAGEPPANGDGLSFTSPDGKAVITVYGGFQVYDTVAEGMAALEEPLEGETITYHHRGDRTVTVSGLRGGTIFYRKWLLSCGDTVWNGVSIEYPAADKAAYDDLVARVAKSLKAGRGYETEDCAD